MSTLVGSASLDGSPPLLVSAPGGAGAEAPPQPFAAWCNAHYWPGAAAILALAAFNLFFRLDREVVTDWDESLYAISAWEAVTHGNWVGTTFLGEIDYYNSKPPLNVWLIGLAFKVFGPSLLSLRLWSAAAAWATVAVLQEWSRRAFGRLVALSSSLVLSMTFAFFYVHSGRSGNTDALFTLVILLTVVTLWAAQRHPRHTAWLGPLIAAAFLLKGMGVLLPLAIVAAVAACQWWRVRERRWPLAIAVALCVAPVAAWGIARWSIDGATFFRHMVRNDLVRISLVALDGHQGSAFFYLDALQKNQYEWLAAGGLAWLLFPVSWSRIRARIADPQHRDVRVLLACYGGACLLIPTLMQTKLPWYLNPFYPAFALATGATLARALAMPADRTPATRRALFAVVLVLAVSVAQGKLIWYSHTMRDISGSAQGVLLAERQRLAGARVFRESWNPADVFVLQALAGGEPAIAADHEAFMRQSRPGDYFMTSPAQPRSAVLMPVRSAGEYALYARPQLPRD